MALACGSAVGKAPVPAKLLGGCRSLAIVIPS
jgi:hypothetical protein